jgi:NAD(P)-dependent dehydrogenase (short-subunit alcohol dehydrogenase family)
MQTLEPKLAGKVALVTGSARGLGRAYALRLARLGADVAINDIDLNAAAEFGEQLSAETVTDECRGFGVRSIGIQADVSVKSQVERMIEQIYRELGALDILVNNAGGMLRPADRNRPTTMPEDDFRFIVDINLMGTVFCCQAAVPLMRQAGWGRIVNVASGAAIGALGSMECYGIAKAGIVHYTRSLAREVAPHGINVNCLAPALIGTSRAFAQFPERRDAGPSIPLGRVGVPEDCAKVVEFFCTDLSDYVTGQVLPVCGGLITHGI